MSGYAKRLGLFSGTMAVIGGIIGSGIFLNSSIVAARVGTSGLTLGVWALGAVVAVSGAFVFAELGQRLPTAGGQYAYLRRAFGPLAGFLQAWSLLLIVATGAIAAVAYTFATYLVALVGAPVSWTTPIAVAAIAVLTGVNIIGVAPGAAVQNVFTVLKLGALAVLIVAGIAGPVTMPVVEAVARPEGSLILAVGAALVPVLFSYGGWQQTNSFAEEFVDPKKTLPKAILLGVAVVVVVYLLANVGYLRVLGTGGLALSRAPAADTMAAVLGDAGRRFISAGIVASTFGFLGLVILASPRVYQALARDGLFFNSFATLHPRYRTPVSALLFQAVWAGFLLLTNRYGQLLDYVVFADWIFFGSTALALVVIRRQDGSGGSGFRVPLFPVTMTIFVAAAIYVVIGSIWSNPANAVRGAGLLLLGIPVYSWRARRGSTTG